MLALFTMPTNSPSDRKNSESKECGQAHNNCKTDNSPRQCPRWGLGVCLGLGVALGVAVAVAVAVGEGVGLPVG
ncbi:MAG TPA: hypothetical protein VIG91_03545, partial [Terriglobales bacterium]